MFTICYAAAVLAQDETKVCFVNESSTIAEQFATLIHSCFTFVPRCFDDTTDTYMNICIHIDYAFSFFFSICVDTDLLYNLCFFRAVWIPVSALKMPMLPEHVNPPPFPPIQC